MVKGKVKHSKGNNMSRSKRRKIGKLFKKHLPFQQEQDWQKVRNSSKREINGLIPSKIGGKLYNKFINKGNPLPKFKTLKTDAKWADRVEHLEKETFDQFSLNLSQISSSIMSFPSENIYKISSYIKYLQQNKDKNDDKIKATIDELFKIFSDLIPGYKIMERSDLGSTLLKKDTRDLMTFERHFLSFYEKFLTVLMDRRCSHSMEVLGNFLLDFPHFNRSEDITGFMVDSLDSWTAEDILKKVLTADELGEISLTVVSCIYVRRKTLTKKMISVLKDLKICVDSVVLEEKTDRRLMSRRERKENKEYKILEKEMRHTEIAENKQRVVELNREILEKMFYILFKIIKTGGDLMSESLELLAKFAKHVNIELVGDLLERFRDMLSGDVDGRDRINILRAAFEISAGDDVTLSVDQSTFMSSLGFSLFDATDGILECLLTVAGRCANLLTQEHVEMIVRRITTACLYSPPSVILSYFEVLKRLISSKRLCGRLLGGDEGVYSFCGEEEGGVLWQLNLLRTHHHPQVRNGAEGILSHIPRNIVREWSAGDLMETFGDVDYAGLDRPGKIRKRKWRGFLWEDFALYDV